MVELVNLVLGSHMALDNKESPNQDTEVLVKQVMVSSKEQDNKDYLNLVTVLKM